MSQVVIHTKDDQVSLQGVKFLWIPASCVFERNHRQLSEMSADRYVFGLKAKGSSYFQFKRYFAISSLTWVVP